MESPMPAFNAHSTVGAMEIGLMVSSFLFGVVTLQTILYFERFSTDSRTLKSLVAFLWTLELGHAILVSHATYTMTVTNYGNPLTLIKTSTSLNASVIISGFIAPLVQSVFIERVRKISGELYVPIFCWVLSFLRCIGSLTIGTEALKMETVVQFESDWGWLIETVMITGSVVDVVIAASLCYYLREKHDSAFQSTTRLVDTLSRWAIQTGLVTSLAALSVAITFCTMRRNFIWIALYTLLARCFSNSLLATLNARTRLWLDAGGNIISGLRCESSHDSWGVVSETTSRFSPDTIQIAIEATRTTEEAHEMETTPRSNARRKMIMSV